MDDANLGTAMDLIGRKAAGKPKPMACCPRDGAPLIATIRFLGAEFYCLECGAKLGFLSPRPVEVTPELHARERTLRGEWDEHVEGHERGDLRKHEEALRWLADR